MSRKTIRAGKAGVFSASTCGLRALCAIISREGPRVPAGTRSSLRPLIEEGGAKHKARTHRRRENELLRYRMFDKQIS